MPRYPPLRKLLLLGSSGLLGQAVTKFSPNYGYSTIGLSRGAASDLQIDLLTLNPQKVREIIKYIKPALIINAAAVTNLEDCENKPEISYQIHAKIPALFAEGCHDANIPFVQVSTDHYYMADGITKHDENSSVILVNEYAKSKFTGELLVKEYDNSMILRTNIVGFRGWMGRPTFVEWALESLRSKKNFPAFVDMMTSSIDVNSFCKYLFILLDCNARGIINLAAKNPCAKIEFIKMLAAELNLDASGVVPSSVIDVSGIPRAYNLGLDVALAERIIGNSLPDFPDVINALVPLIKRSQ